MSSKGRESVRREREDRDNCTTESARSDADYRNTPVLLGRRGRAARAILKPEELGQAERAVESQG